MSGAVSWDQLQQHYMSDAAFQEEIVHMVRDLTPVRARWTNSVVSQLYQ
jgi:hypothetical protein